MPYGITWCYLSSGRGDIPAFTPADAATRFSDPRTDARLSLPNPKTLTVTGGQMSGGGECPDTQPLLRDCRFSLLQNCGGTSDFSSLWPLSGVG